MAARWGRFVLTSSMDGRWEKKSNIRKSGVSRRVSGIETFKWPLAEVCSRAKRGGVALSGILLFPLTSSGTHSTVYIVVRVWRTVMATLVIISVIWGTVVQCGHAKQSLASHRTPRLMLAPLTRSQYIWIPLSICVFYLFIYLFFAFLFAYNKTL